jgi:hypothetical protein
VNFHWRTASTAALSKTGTGLITLMQATSPVSSIQTPRMMVPCASKFWRYGHVGSTRVLTDAGTIVLQTLEGCAGAQSSCSGRTGDPWPAVRKANTHISSLVTGCLDTTQRTSAQPLRGRQRDEGSGRAGAGIRADGAMLRHCAGDGKTAEDSQIRTADTRRSPGIRRRWFSAVGAEPQAEDRWGQPIRQSRIGVPSGIRTRVAAVKGRCPRPLDDGDVEGSSRLF